MLEQVQAAQIVARNAEEVCRRLVHGVDRRVQPAACRSDVSIIRVQNTSSIA
jgi:hypothetical protein